MSSNTEKLKSHSKKATVEIAAIKEAIVHPTLNGRDRDLLYKSMTGVMTEVDFRDMNDLADRLAKA